MSNVWKTNTERENILGRLKSNAEREKLLERFKTNTERLKTNDETVWCEEDQHWNRTILERHNSWELSLVIYFDFQLKLFDSFIKIQESRQDRALNILR